MVGENFSTSIDYEKGFILYMNFGGRLKATKLKRYSCFLLKDTWDAVYGNVKFLQSLFKTLKLPTFFKKLHLYYESTQFLAKKS